MKKDIAWAAMKTMLLLMTGYVIYHIGYSAGGKAKLIKSDNATLIEGLCIDVINNAEEKVS